jgi:hypothetical protein
MLSIHATYDRSRLEKLDGMFGDDARQGNMTLYVREHFDLKRICERCGKRTTANRLAVASIIIEGPAWVLPISLQHDGQIAVDLEWAIPDQSNLLAPAIVESLLELGMTLTRDDRDYIITPERDHDGLFRNASRDAYAKYSSAREQLGIRVITDASPDDVLSWDTEVEYDYERYCTDHDEERSSGYNVQTEYFQWLAEHGQLVLARISDESDRTLGIAYCVPGDYYLSLMRYKWKLEPEQRYGVRNALLFALADHLDEKKIRTPLNLGATPDSVMELWTPAPVAKERLEISNRVAQQAILDAFGSK